MARGKTLFNFGNYTFSSWARRGIANSIAPNGNSPVRANVPLTIKLNNEPLSQPVDLLGPPDISGILSDAIVRTEPLPGNFNFEWNFLPYIEFYDEDFLWRYTPDAPDTANNNLRPWLALVLLQQTEFTELQGNGGQLPAIRLQADALPPAQDLHLWAHMHTGSHAGVSGNLDNILLEIADNFPKDPDGFTCRLICPRRLEKKTMYHAFLIPSYETGRLAGLGEKFNNIPAREAAWTDANRPATLDFPVYYRWSFATTDTSFEDLLSKMQTGAANPQIGVRNMNISNPGYCKADGTLNVGKPLITGTDDNNKMGLEGALRTPATVSTPYVADGKSDDFQKDVGGLLNLYDQSAPGNTTYAMASNADPILTIPLYGWNYVNTRGLPPSPIKAADTKNWYPIVNYDPRNRVAAGLGTQVIQAQQETLMQSAWYQLQTLEKAKNQFGAVGSIMQRMTDRLTNVDLVPSEDFVSMARSMTGRIKDPSTNTTILQNLHMSATPNAIINSATRRVMRINGNFGKRLLQTTTAQPVKLNLKVVNSNLTDAALKFRRFKLGGIKVPGTFVIAGTIPTPFDRAFADYAARVRKGNAGIESVFLFATAQKNIQTAIQAAPSKLIRTKINFQITTTTASASNPPAEFLGQPAFFSPMYEPLWKLDKEWFLPNISLIEDNTITLLETNAQFINSYMLGLNDEIGREMLWRQFPADLSVTFFRNFWQANDGEIDPVSFDIDPVKKWIATPAPERRSAGTTSKLVLTLRGELLRKFPNTVILAALLQRSAATGKLSFDNSTSAASFKFPSFRADIPPDLQFLGFDLSVDQVIADSEDPAGNIKSWYFILMEPVGEPRFGLDAEFRPGDMQHPEVYNRNDLSWDHFKNPGLPGFLNSAFKPNIASSPNADADKNLWGENSASMGALLFQQPFVLVVKATDMIKI